MSENDLTQDPQAVDVSHSDTHYQVQCAEVRLVTSSLRPLTESVQLDASRFAFKIEAYVQGNTALSYLHVQVIAIEEGDEQPKGGYELQFTLMAVFVAEGEIQPEALGDFARTYTLSILWPYAREYTGDQLRRAGQPFDALPIINPQVVTEKLIEADLVTVQFIADEPA
jgi:preprotein translocase subunit SecB